MWSFFFFSPVQTHKNKPSICSRNIIFSSQEKLISPVDQTKRLHSRLSFTLNHIIPLKWPWVFKVTKQHAEAREVKIGVSGDKKVGEGERPALLDYHSCDNTTWGHSLRKLSLKTFSSLSSWHKVSIFMEEAVCLVTFSHSYQNRWDPVGPWSSVGGGWRETASKTERESSYYGNITNIAMGTGAPEHALSRI